MSDLETWLLSVAAFAVSMAGTPGPNNAMVAASGANFGFARTVPHLLGISLGFPAMLIAVALGAGSLLRAAPALHVALKWIGIAYLLYLALKIATTRSSAPNSPDPGTPATRPLTFLQAASFQWVNPKAWIIAVGGIAAYTTAGPAMLGQAAALAAIFLLATLPCVAFWTLTGVGAARLLRTPRQRRAFNLVMAALLVASLVPLLLEP